MKNELLLEQAVTYLSSPGFARLMQQLKERYDSLGRMGGTVLLKQLTLEEAIALEGFLQQQCVEGCTLKLTLAQIRKAQLRTKYSELLLEDIVSHVLGEVMVSRKEKREQYERERGKFFRKLLEDWTADRADAAGVAGSAAKADRTGAVDDVAKADRADAAGSAAEADRTDTIDKSDKENKTCQWFKHVLESKTEPWSMLNQDYQNNRSWLENNLPNILDALQQLPIKREEEQLLPVFSASITGNPHYFDEGQRACTYLLYGIAYFCDRKITAGLSTQDRAELYRLAGILKDDLSNWVLCYGIHGCDEKGTLHPGMEEYIRRREPQLLSLRNINHLSCAFTSNKKVYIVENPAVFSKIMESKTEGIACICSSGQLKLSVFLLLDLLYKGETEFYYCGDFDPEGLLIAQKLKSRYEAQVVWWNFDEEHYKRAQSNELLSERRLKQLELLQDQHLRKLAKIMKQEGFAGYQENILEEYTIDE